jgi:hypothetical protein
MAFPTDWPINCPPNHAQHSEVEVFRIVKDDPPTATDMLSHHETGRLPKADPCLRCGLSVFRVLADAQNQQQLMPRLGNRIARGVLLPTHGKSLPTPGIQPTHTTWWPFVGVIREGFFSVVWKSP